MLGDQIKKYRKEKKMSQEELAIPLNVVRQTVSKWENNLSVPDAELLIRLAEVLEISVAELLGADEQPQSASLSAETLGAELARLNEELARQVQERSLSSRAEQKRNLILFFSMLSMLFALIIDNTTASVLLTSACILAAVIILYRNTALLTRTTTSVKKLGAVRITTIFNIGVLAVCIVVFLLSEMGILPFSDRDGKFFAMLLVSAIILFTGMISSRLPFNRHTGLRLPWTVHDEDTWNVAHRVLHDLSIPIVLLYLGCTLTVPDFETVTLFTIGLWIGIPSVISGVFFWKKMHGR
nr:XRE family transcriptional regulator [uncultured Faecalimonas sp.]